jgi:hypothetical protein
MTKISYKTVAAKILAHHRLFARQGAVVPVWRSIDGRKCGPYYRLAYRDHLNRQRSIYLGPNKRLARDVKSLLDKLQTPLFHRRHSIRACAALRAGLRLHKIDWKSNLAARGLYLKGFTVRGWRKLPCADKIAKRTIEKNALQSDRTLRL